MTFYEFALKFATDHWFLSFMAIYLAYEIAAIPVRVMSAVVAVMAKKVHKDKP